MPLLTPTVRLNSFALSRKLTVLYTEQEEEKKEKLDTMFKFQLKCDDLEEIGEGKSKQQAKHNAAQKVLDVLKTRFSNDPYFKESSDLTPEEEVHLKLKEMGLVPKFNYVGEEGSATNRFYTVQCVVKNFVTQAKARGRKNARREVCQKLLKFLNENKTIPETASTEDKLSENANDVEVSEDLKCIFTDPISVLQEHRICNNLNPPAYSTSYNAAIYTVTASTGTISYTAAAKNKKLAKQCAAAGILDIMGVKERPKKKVKVKRRPMRHGNPSHFRSRGSQHGSRDRQHAIHPGLTSRPKVYEPSHRAISYNRRHGNPHNNTSASDKWTSHHMRSYFDIF